MDDPELDPRLAFARQRRTLLGVSLVLIGFQSVGATISEISLLGNHIALRTPLDVATPLWIAWFYLCVRAYQHYRDIPGSPVLDRYTPRLQIEVIAAAADIAVRDLRKDITRDMVRPKQVRIEDLTGGIVEYWPTFWGVDLAGTAVAVSGDNLKGRSQLLTQHRVKVPIDRVRQCKFRAAFWITLHTPVFTEYFLPLVVALLPPVRALRMIL